MRSGELSIVSSGGPIEYRGIDRMKAAGLPLNVVAYAAPQGLHAVNAAERRGRPLTILME